MPTFSPQVRAAIIVAATAAMYVAAAQFRVAVAFTNGTLPLVTPPTGITLSVVLLWGPIALPGVVIAALITYLTHGWPAASFWRQQSGTRSKQHSQRICSGARTST
jgi:hypothetical protein